jgi:hypothetical protein
MNSASVVLILAYIHDEHGVSRWIKYRKPPIHALESSVFPICLTEFIVHSTSPKLSILTSTRSQ